MRKCNIDEQESLRSYLDLFKNSYNGGGNNRLSVKDIIDNIIGVYAGKLTDDNSDENILPLLDSSMQLDGAFFKFCEENNLTVENLKIDVVNILPYADAEYDPFVVNGLFLITDNKGFSFIKSSLIKFSNNTESVSALTVLSTQNYAKYSELKNKYVKWIRAREGIVVKVIDGEEYFLDADYNFKDLFFGEKDEVKQSIKSKLDKFFASKEVYSQHHVPWNYSMLIHGNIGVGKSQLIKTIITEYDLDPLTVNYYHVDDAILSAAFTVGAEQPKTVLFIEDVDELINQNFISVENLIGLLNHNKANNGMLILLSCRKMPEMLEKILCLDDSVEITKPDYDKSVSFFFDKFFTAAQLKELQDMISKSEMPYSYICKLYKLFIKSGIIYNVAPSPTTKKKDSTSFNELKNIFKKIQKEYTDTVVRRNKTKKIGLLGTTKE